MFDKVLNTPLVITLISLQKNVKSENQILDNVYKNIRSFSYLKWKVVALNDIQNCISTLKNI